MRQMHSLKLQFKQTGQAQKTNKHVFCWFSKYKAQLSVYGVKSHNKKQLGAITNKKKSSQNRNKKFLHIDF